MDEVVSRVNGNVYTLSLAVRTFISQRNLKSLTTAIERGNGPYDGLRQESDDSNISFHQKDLNVIRTIHQNEQDTKLQKGLDEKPRQKADDGVSPIFNRAASFEDDEDVLTERIPSIIALPLRWNPSQIASHGADDEITIPREPFPRISSDQLSQWTNEEDDAWQRFNLLSLGCTVFFTV